MRVINKGENVLIRRNLKKADGTDLLLADISSLTVAIIQDGYVIEQLAYPSAYLRQGESTSQLELEISTTISGNFKTGKVTLKYTVVFPNTDFDAEGIQKDIVEEQALTVK